MDGMAVDHEVAGLAGDRGRDPDADVVDLHRLGTGAAQLLDGVEDVGDPHLLVGVVDGQPEPCSARRDRAVEDADGLRLPTGLGDGGGGLAVGAAQLLQGRPLVGELLAEPLLAGVELVEDAHEVLLARPGVLVVVADAAHLHGEGEAEQQCQHADERRRETVAAPALTGHGPRRLRPRQLRGRLRDGRGRGRRVGGRRLRARRLRARRLCARRLRRRLGGLGVRRPFGSGPELRDRAPRRALGHGVVRSQAVAHARKTCRRMAAALPKMRMPSTTTTAVDSWAPTPSWSPRKTMSAATTTFDTNEMTNTLASKIPSSRARSPPKTASRAATTAMGR